MSVTARLEAPAGVLSPRERLEALCDPGSLEVLRSRVVSPRLGARAVAGDGVLNPAVSFLVRGNGARAWYGWPTDPELERLRLAWFGQPTLAGQKQVADAIQRDILQQAPYLPLGQILQPTVYRKDLAGILPGFAKFWSVRKA